MLEPVASPIRRALVSYPEWSAVPRVGGRPMGIAMTELRVSREVYRAVVVPVLGEILRDLWSARERGR